MDAVATFLEGLNKKGLTRGHLRGLFNVLIGRRIAAEDGTLIASGLTWRELAALLKRLRWDPEQVRELGLEPSALPPRDRQRYWYTAITRARVDSTEAAAAGNRFAEVLRTQGYDVGAAPSA
jgi:hypothetical protein